MGTSLGRADSEPDSTRRQRGQLRALPGAPAQDWRGRVGLYLPNLRSVRSGGAHAHALQPSCNPTASGRRPHASRLQLCAPQAYRSGCGNATAGTCAACEVGKYKPLTAVNWWDVHGRADTGTSRCSPACGKCRLGGASACCPGRLGHTARGLCCSTRPGGGGRQSGSSRSTRCRRRSVLTWLAPLHMQA